MKRIEICIPLYNEALNLEDLLFSLNEITSHFSNYVSVLLLDNASEDDTKKILSKKLKGNNNISFFSAERNLGYGGGMLQLIRASKSDFVCLLPGDLQYSSLDVIKCIETFNLYQLDDIFLIANRVHRQDNPSQIVVSRVYSKLLRYAWKLPSVDVNALPKIFIRNLVVNEQTTWESNFLFDAQLILNASKNGYKFIEVPVTFYRRGAGLSSWSGKRLKTYKSIFKQIIRLRP